MKQHPFDPVSFFFGIFFLVMAGVAVVRQDIDWNVGIWVLPAAILALGVGLLASSLRASVTED